MNREKALALGTKLKIHTNIPLFEIGVRLIAKYFRATKS